MKIKIKPCGLYSYENQKIEIDNNSSNISYLKLKENEIKSKLDNLSKNIEWIKSKFEKEIGFYKNQHKEFLKTYNYIKLIRAGLK